MSRFQSSKSFFLEPLRLLSVVRRGNLSSRGIDREIIGDEHESDLETRNDSSASESGAKIESSLS